VHVEPWPDPVVLAPSTELPLEDLRGLDGSFPETFVNAAGGIGAGTKEEVPDAGLELRLCVGTGGARFAGGVLLRLLDPKAVPDPGPALPLREEDRTDPGEAARDARGVMGGVGGGVLPLVRGGVAHRSDACVLFLVRGLGGGVVRLVRELGGGVGFLARVLRDVVLDVELPDDRAAGRRGGITSLASVCTATTSAITSDATGSISNSSISSSLTSGDLVTNTSPSGSRS